MSQFTLINSIVIDEIIDWILNQENIEYNDMMLNRS